MDQNPSSTAEGEDKETARQAVVESRSRLGVVPGRWVEAARMAEVWLPDYFRPEYDPLDESFADGSLRWVRLGDLVELHGAVVSSTPEANLRWRAQATTTSLEIREDLTSGHAPIGGVVLPDGAILVRLGGSGLIQVEYWDSLLYPGGGLAGLDVAVFTARHSVDPAWLVWELRTNDLIKLQIQRSAHATAIPRIEMNTLLDLRLQMPSADEQARCANTVRGMIRQDLSLTRAQAIIETAKRTQRAFIVTGVTLQDRLRQFEQYLVREEWIAPRSLYSIDKVEDERKFILQPIQRTGSSQRFSAGSVVTRRPMELEADSDWLEWSQSTKAPWKLFNSLLGKDDLPPAILNRILVHFESRKGSPSAATSVPSFDTWRQLYRSIWDLQGTLGPSDWSQITRAWLTQSPELRHPNRALESRGNQESAPIEAEESLLIDLVRQVSRPVLALKAICEDRVVRIYLILGPDQTDDPLHSAALLEGYASILSENLHQATHFAAEAAKMESLRRLSWLRHHLNGPIGIISNALDDIATFLRNNPKIASELVPDKDIAQRMAARPGREIRDYTVRARLGVVGRELDRLKSLSDRIKQLSEMGDDETMSPVDIALLLRNRAEACKELAPGMALQIHGCTECVLVDGNADKLAEVFDEVLYNASREFKEQRTPEPCLDLTLQVEANIVSIEVRDNALPITDYLPPNAFLEGVTKYRDSGGGTGLGLTFVGGIIAVHGGHCSLEENRTPVGERLPGATFKISLPVSTVKEDVQ